MRKAIVFLFIVACLASGCGTDRWVKYSKSPALTADFLEGKSVAVLPLFFYKTDKIFGKKALNSSFSRIVKKKIIGGNIFDYKTTLKKLSKSDRKKLITIMEAYRSGRVIDKLAILDLGKILGCDYVLFPILNQKSVDKYSAMRPSHGMDESNYQLNFQLEVKLMDIKRQAVIFTALANDAAEYDNNKLLLHVAFNRAVREALSRL